MAELSTGAKVGIVLGVASLVGVGAYFLLKKPSTTTGQRVLANQKPPLTLPELQKQNPQMDTAALLKLFSQLMKGSKSGGSSGGGGTSGGGSGGTGTRPSSNPYAGYKAYPDYTGYKDPYGDSGYGNAGYGDAGYGDVAYGGYGSYGSYGYAGGGDYSGGGYGGYYAGGGDYSGGYSGGYSGYYAGGGDYSGGGSYYGYA